MNISAKQKTIRNILVGYSQSINERTLSDRYLNRIRAAAPGAHIHIFSGKMPWETFKTGAPVEKTDVAFGRIYGAWIHDLPELCWIQLTSAGADRLMQNATEIRRRNLIITNSSGVHAKPIAEHIIALMLTFSRGIHRSIRRQIRHAWVNRDHQDRIVELSGATLGIIGLGRIGQMAAMKAKAMGMTVIGLRRRPQNDLPFVDKIYAPGDLAILLSSSDWVVLALPLTSGTEGLIGEDELRAMKPEAVLINIARGKIIQEDALIRALEKKWIAGAGLDVFAEEPLPEESLLWDLENVVITPHNAGVSPRLMERRLEIFTENIRCYQTGKPLINVVDMNLGY